MHRTSEVKDNQNALPLPVFVLGGEVMLTVSGERVGVGDGALVLLSIVE